MLATRLSEDRVPQEVEWREGGTPIRVLPAAGVFGANASGKSNLLKVMADMRAHVVYSFRRGDPDGGIPRRPFLLDRSRREEPSEYEVDLVLDGVRHLYGFSIDDNRVIEEWAYRYPKGRPALIFRRDSAQVHAGSVERQKTRAVQELLRPNALFLSAAASVNHAALLPLYKWFNRNLLLAEADSRQFRQLLTIEMLDDPTYRDRVLALLQAADLGITGARKQELDPVIRERLRRALRIMRGADDQPDHDEGSAFEELGIRFVHASEDDEDVELDPRNESLGTRVWFGLIGPVVNALERGSVLLADELDASLHTELATELVNLFQDPITNPRRSQLIFNSHDATLLGDAAGDRLLGRDQIWFTEKLNDGRTRLYPLTDLEPRKLEAIGKRYLDGWYGATPILSRGELASAVAFDSTGDL